MIYERQQGSAVVSTDMERIDLTVVHGFLSQAYWSQGVTRETVQRSIEHSIPFGVYVDDHQVGFARGISDRTTFAYLSDVFVLPEVRGQGLGHFLIESILAHPELQSVRMWTLFTRDAHELYEKSGFERGKMLDRLMVQNDWIVRGGLAHWQDLQIAYKPVSGVPNVYGFSVQYAPGITVPDLIQAGQFPHRWISYADRAALEQAMLDLGYTLLLIKTRGLGYHHDLALTLVQQGQILNQLPDSAAQALSALFKQHQLKIKP